MKIWIAYVRAHQNVSINTGFILNILFAAIKNHHVNLIVELSTTFVMNTEDTGNWI